MSDRDEDHKLTYIEPMVRAEPVRIDYAQSDLDYWHRVQLQTVEARLRLDADPFNLGHWSETVR